MNANPTTAAKFSSALRLARTRAIMDVLEITPGPFQPGCLEGKELDEYVQERYDRYCVEQEFDKPENAERRSVFLQAITQAEIHRGAFIMYHPQHVASWLGKIENTPLHLISSRIDKDIVLFTLEMTRHYGISSFNAQDARYLLRILQERMHVLQGEGLTDNNQEAIQRFEAGVVELQEIEQKLRCDQTSKNNELSEEQKDQASGIQPTLSIRQIVLLYIYQNKPRIKGIVRAREVAVEHGFKSGERLYSLYNKLREVKDRINVEGRQVEPLVKDIEAVLPYLSGEQNKQAQDELVTIKLKSPKLV